MGQSVCPWCGELVALYDDGTYTDHRAPWMSIGRECPASELTIQGAEEMTAEAIAYHAATGDDLPLRGQSASSTEPPSRGGSDS